MKIKLKMKSKHVLYLLIIVIATFFIMWQFITNKLIVGDDLRFHVNRILSYSNIWRSPVNFKTFANTGKAVSIFYPPYFFYITHFINKIVHSIEYTYKIYIFLLVLIGGFASYISANIYFKNEDKSLIFSILYICSQYLLSLVYVRYAVAEFTAFAFIPLVLVSIYEVFFRNYNYWWLLSLSLIIVINNHILTFLLLIFFAIVSFIYLLIFERKKLDKQRILRIVISILVVILSSLIIIVPIWEQVKSNDLIMTKSYPTFTNLVYPFQKILPYFFDTSLVRIDINHVKYFSIGPIVFIISILNLVMYNKINNFEKMLVVLSTVFIILQTDIFPWKIFDYSRVLFIQFPFRLNSFITLFSIFVFASSFDQLFTVKKFNLFIVLILIVQFVVMFFSITQINNYFDAKNYIGINDSKVFNNRRRTEKQILHLSKKLDIVSNSDYLHKNRWIKNKVHGYNVNQIKSYSVWNNIWFNGKIQVKKPNYGASTYNYNQINDTGKSGIVEIPLTNYHGINVKVNGKTSGFNISRRGNLLITISKEKISKISITYSWTKLALISRYISILSIILLILFIIINFWRK